MEQARQHWQILQQVDKKFTDRVRSFMVIGLDGDGVLMVTKPDGEAYWFGKMRFGDRFRQTLEPIPLGVSKVVSMAHGDQQMLLLNEQGQIYMFGKVTQQIFSSHRFISIRCGGYHNLALTHDGKVWAWGINSRGQIGVSSSKINYQSSLHKISELNLYNVISIVCGVAHSLALTDQGEVFAWGWNYYGQLGHYNKFNDMSGYHLPTKMPPVGPVKSMAAGYTHTLLLTQKNEVYACGYNGYGQLGLLTSINSSVCLRKVAGLPPISEIASHYNTSLSIAISYQRECFVWGRLAECTSISSPLKLPSIYSTIDSVYSFKLTQCNNPISVQIGEGEKDTEESDIVNNSKN